MKSPGTMLREAREERELSLDDMAAMTRIPRPMLEHLEKDRFEEYVAEVFLRGHLRNYGRELHLDVDQLVRAYERHTGRTRANSVAEFSTEKEDSGRGTITASGGGVARARRRASVAMEESSSRFARAFGGIRRSHLVAVILVVIGLFLMFGYLTNNRATAQDPVEFPQVDESAWEQDVEETRWLLEQTEE